MRARRDGIIAMGRRFLRGDGRWGWTEREFVHNLSMVFDIDPDFIRDALREAEFQEWCFDNIEDVPVIEERA